MKKRYLLLFLLLTAASTYAQTTETEPNNSFVQANEIQDGVVVKTAIGTAGDKDYFKFTSTKAGVLRVSLENVPAAIDPDVYVYNSANTLLVVEYGGHGLNNYADVTICGAGDYYILVQSSSNSDQSPDLMNLKVVLGAEDIYECNNSFTDAKPIQNGVPVQIAIGDEGDVDYFKFTTTKTGVLRVSLENVPAAIDPDVYVYNSANTLLVVEYGGHGQNNYADVAICSAGDYYILVKSSSNSDKSPDLMNLRVVLGVEDIYECNNSFSDAKPIQDGVPIQIAIGDEGDLDYFKFTPSRTGVIRVSLENVPAVIDPDVYVYNSANTLLVAEYGTHGQNNYADVTVCDTQTYYILVRSSSSSDKSSDLMNLRVVLGVEDVYECNNSFSDAKPIQDGVPVQIAIGDEGDKDYFKFTSTKAGVLRVSLENVPAAIDPDIYVYNSANTQLVVKYGTYGQNNYANVAICGAGDYFVLVRSSSNSDKSAQLMNLKVVLDAKDQFECNNTFADAKDISLGQPIQADLSVEGDVDYFKFTVVTQTTLNITIPTPPTSLNPRITIYNGSQQQVSVATGSNNQTVSINNLNLAPGTYYVKVSQTNNYVNELYTLYVSTNCIPFTVKAGNWNDPTVWLCGQVPGSNDPVVLRHVITVPGSYTAHASQVSYEGGGSLSLGTNGQLQLGN